MRLSQLSPEVLRLRAHLAQAFGPVLHQARTAAGLTREQLAEKAHVQHSTIEKIENNRRGCAPSLIVLISLEGALGLEPGELTRRVMSTQAGIVAPGTGTSASTWLT